MERGAIAHLVADYSRWLVERAGWSRRNLYLGAAAEESPASWIADQR